MEDLDMSGCLLAAPEVLRALVLIECLRHGASDKTKRLDASPGTTLVI